ncbi:phage tail assembly chaperone [Ectopseudomonas oleovorans]|uniref:phage tail assembly chaperone n=1 Tax=Ectopseudomonas oleovorans TaxID=301 RepID=UPI0035B3B711
MKAYYDSVTSHVIMFSSEDMDGNYVDVQDVVSVMANLNLGKIAKVNDGVIVFESDRAALLKRIRERRGLLLAEADVYANKINDQALISGVEPGVETLKSIAIYRQQLRNIVETNDPENIVWPKKPWITV